MLKLLAAFLVVLFTAIVAVLWYFTEEEISEED